MRYSKSRICGHVAFNTLDHSFSLIGVTADGQSFPGGSLSATLRKRIFGIQKLTVDVPDGRLTAFHRNHIRGRQPGDLGTTRKISSLISG